jgi:hypothetical protein
MSSTNIIILNLAPITVGVEFTRILEKMHTLIYFQNKNTWEK